MDGPLLELFHRTDRPRILVVGDAMLDRYLWGEVERISPEAPIPVLRVAKQEDRLGGAGNVAAMLAALEAKTMLATVLGDDAEGRKIRRLLDAAGIEPEAVITVAGRESTVKQRLLGRTHGKHPQQMLRVDREQNRPVQAEIARQLLSKAEMSLSRVDLILVSDYDKGVCAGDFIPTLIQLANAKGVAVLADPVCGAPFARYAGCACITPNRTEAATAAQITIRTPDDGLEAARRLLSYGIDSVVVTLDRDGMAWADQSGHACLCPVRPREVYDVTGAGDMVLSALGYCLAAGADYPTAIAVANAAGGLEVERMGVVPISRAELLAELERDTSCGTCSTTAKIVSVEALQAELTRRRQRGERIAMTNGCFDLLHPGHIASLQAARRHGDCLVVGLNSDRSLRELKGEGRPIIDQQGRAEMLAALACVDYVVLFDDASVFGLVEQVLPDVLVKAAEYTTEQVVGHELVERHGGRIVRVPMKGTYSTRRIVQRIRQATDGDSPQQQAPSRPGQAAGDDYSDAPAAAIKASQRSLRT